MGETDVAVIRIERRMDRLEENVGEKLDRVTDKLVLIAEGQAEAKATASGLERLWTAHGKLEERIAPLERDAPLVNIITEGLKKLLRGVIYGSFLIGAAVLVGSIYPYMPWVKSVPVVTIEAPRK